MTPRDRVVRTALAAFVCANLGCGSEQGGAGDKGVDASLDSGVETSIDAPLDARGDAADAPDESGRAEVGGEAGVVDPGPISSSASSSFQAETTLATSTTGAVAVAWIDVRAAGDAIGYAISTDLGARFSPPALLFSPGGRLASDPSLVSDADGSFHLVWIGYAAGARDGHVYLSSAAPGSATFGPVSEVTDPTEKFFYDRPTIARTNKGTLLVTYARGAEGASATDALFVARSTDGAAWTRVMTTTGSEYADFIYPCAPRAGARVWYVASDQRAGGLVVRASDDDGQTWPAASATPVFVDGNIYGDPKCVARDDEVWVMDGLPHPETVAPDALPKLDGIRLTHSSDGGRTFDAPVDVADHAAAPFFQRPILTVEDTGFLDLVYYAGARDADLAGSYRRARTVAPSTTTFGASSVVHAPIEFLQSRSSSRWIGDYTGLEVAGGRLFTSYVDNSGSVSHVAFWAGPVP